VGETLAECLDRINAFYEKDRPARLAATPYTRSTEADGIREEAGLLANNRRPLIQFAEFLRNCKVVIGKPRVMRVKGPSRRQAFHHRGRYIMPVVTLVWKDRKLTIETLSDLEDWHMTYKTGNSQVRESQVPHLYMAWGEIALYRSGPNANLYEAFLEPLVAAFNRDAGDNWKNAVVTIRAEWARVEGQLDALVAAQFDAKGDKERREFQTKLMKMLASTKGLIDVSPEAIFEIFKLGYDEITELAKFSSRNKADIGLVQLEDIVEAQDLIRVRKVMES
jgi:hypothetical protein